MRQKFRKFIAFALSSVMVMGSPMSALAEETGQTESTGFGQMEGGTIPDIYQVVLPTNVNHMFDFIFDPQRLIEETNAVAYGGLKFEKGATVFFRRLDGQEPEDYSSSSDHLSIINRSNIPVDVFVNVNIAQESLGSIKLTGDSTFANDTGASLYMALTDGQYTVPVGTDGAFIQATIPAAPEEAFEYGYDQEREEYTYRLKNDLNGLPFPEYSFQLTGAVNENGDWSEVGKVSPLVTVTWKVTPAQSVDSDKRIAPVQNIVPEDNLIFSQTIETVPVEEENGEENKTPTIVNTSYTVEPEKPLSIEVDLGSGAGMATKVASVRWKDSETELLGRTEEQDTVKYQDEKILFSKEWVNEYLSDENNQKKVLVVTFDNTEETEAEIVLNK